MSLTKLRLLLAAALVLLLVTWLSWPRVRSGPLSGVEFSELVETLSEPGLPFVSDNLVSNETALGDPLDTLKARLPPGLVYVGVGPEQNFSYIAELRPSYAFIVDVRRENLLQHLFFKALFELEESPRGWLAALLGRTTPPAAECPAWVAALGSERPDPKRIAATRHRVQELLAGYGVALRRSDWRFLTFMHDSFCRQGLDLRFTFRSEVADAPVYPSLRETLLARDPAGRMRHFLAHQESYAAVRTMERENRIVPLVGNFAGRHALRALWQTLRQWHQTVGLFYASNVEYYLMPQKLPDDLMEEFVWNLEGMPGAPGALLLRTYLKDLPGRPPYAHGQPLFIPSLHDAKLFVQRYQAGELPDYLSAQTRDEIAF